ncbi:phosphomannomutase/phosphoglucomutase [Patescibacteria group bacterium]
MKVNPLIFRGYDLRGLVDEDLSPELAEHLGKAFGTYLKRHDIAKAIVSRDCRATSPAYSEALIKGLSWAGIDVVDIGMNMVGTFYWAQHYLKRPGGVMVTASHNPAPYNGFKFANGLSETLVTDGMQELLRMVQAEDYEKSEQPGPVTKQDIRQVYFDDILKRLPIKKKFKVLIDPSNSTAGEIAPEFLRQAGCEVVEKNTNIDPSFPLGTPDPTERDVMERLRDEVIDSQADIGFTYDPDGDRIGIVDAKGTIIWNDILVAIFAMDVLKEHPGQKIMFNTLCSKVVSETIIKHGGEPFMWQTGHSFLKKKNQEVKAAFIGELSGHFFFSADFYNHDDGLYSTLRLLKFLAENGQTLDEVLDTLPKYISSPEIKIFSQDDKKVALMKKISPLLERDFPEAEVIDDGRAGDGVRLELPDSMLVIRYSQNGPYLTIKFEAKEQKQYDVLKKFLYDLLHKFDEIDWSSDINVNTEALS